MNGNGREYFCDERERQTERESERERERERERLVDVYRGPTGCLDACVIVKYGFASVR